LAGLAKDGSGVTSGYYLISDEVYKTMYNNSQGLGDEDAYYHGIGTAVPNKVFLQQTVCPSKPKTETFYDQRDISEKSYTEMQSGGSWECGFPILDANSQQLSNTDAGYMTQLVEEKLKEYQTVAASILAKGGKQLKDLPVKCCPYDGVFGMRFEELDQKSMNSPSRKKDGKSFDSWLADLPTSTDAADTGLYVPGAENCVAPKTKDSVNASYKLLTKNNASVPISIHNTRDHL
jgi:hypothetical protein